MLDSEYLGSFRRASEPGLWERRNHQGWGPSVKVSLMSGRRFGWIVSDAQSLNAFTSWKWKSNLSVNLRELVPFLFLCYSNWGQENTFQVMEELRTFCVYSLMWSYNEYIVSLSFPSNFSYLFYVFISQHDLFFSRRSGHSCLSLCSSHASCDLISLIGEEDCRGACSQILGCSRSRCDRGTSLLRAPPWGQPDVNLCMERTGRSFLWRRWGSGRLEKQAHQWVSSLAPIMATQLPPESLLCPGSFK